MKNTKWNFLKSYFKTKIVNKDTATFFLLLLGFIIFQVSINDFANNFFVESVLKKVEQNTINDIFLILTNTFVICFYIKHFTNKYKQSAHINLLISLVAFIYLYNVIFSNYWEFLTCENIPINYLSIILILFTLNSMLLIINVVHDINSAFRIINNPPKNQSSFQIDEAWKIGDDDLLGRDISAKKMAEEINDMYYDKSFAIGICGEWGSGKTSFLNMLQKHLKDKNGETITIEFNPWRSSSSELIINDFFNTIKNELSKFGGTVSSELENYAKRLAEIDKSGLVKIYNEFFPNTTSLEEQFNKINEIIKGLNRKIVIIIDDVDRLDKKEIIEVIRLIRNTANFYNTFFIVAYDKKYMINAIKDINAHNSDYFLEKIFQLEYLLPNSNRGFIKGHLITILSQKLPESKDEIEKVIRHISDPINASFYMGSGNFAKDYVNEDVVPQYIKTPRDINRLCNSLIYNFKQVEGEVVFRDYLFIELIKLKDQGLYNQICKGKFINIKYKKINNVTSGVYVFKKDELLDHYKTHDFPIVDTLQILFPDKPKDNDRSIAVPSSFNIYFSNQLFEKLSLTRFKKERLKGFEAFKSYIDEIILNKNTKHEFIEVLEKIRAYDNKLDFETIIAAWFYLAEKDIENQYHNMIIEHIQTEAVEQILENYYNQETHTYSNFIKQKLDTTSPYVSFSVLNNIIIEYIYHSKTFRFIFSLEECQKIIIENFKKHLANSHLVTLDTFLYYNSCIQTIKDSRVILIEEANSAFKTFIEQKDPIGYLKTVIIYYNPSDSNKPHYYLDGYIEQIFENYDNFEKFLARLDANNPVVKEVTSFYESFKKNNYKPIPKAV